MPLPPICASGGEGGGKGKVRTRHVRVRYECLWGRKNRRKKIGERKDLNVLRGESKRKNKFVWIDIIEIDSCI